MLIIGSLQFFIHFIISYIFPGQLSTQQLRYKSGQQALVIINQNSMIQTPRINLLPEIIYYKNIIYKQIFNLYTVYQPRSQVTKEYLIFIVKPQNIEDNKLVLCASLKQEDMPRMLQIEAKNLYTIFQALKNPYNAELLFESRQLKIRLILFDQKGNRYHKFIELRFFNQSQYKQLLDRQEKSLQLFSDFQYLPDLKRSCGKSFYRETSILYDTIQTKQNLVYTIFQHQKRGPYYELSEEQRYRYDQEKQQGFRSLKVRTYVQLAQIFTDRAFYPEIFSSYLKNFIHCQYGKKIIPNSAGLIFHQPVQNLMEAQKRIVNLPNCKQLVVDSSLNALHLFKFQNSLITFLGNSEQQTLFQMGSVLPKTQIYVFSVKIVRTLNRNIWVGITEKSKRDMKGHRKRNPKSILYSGKLGYIWQHKLQGNGFRQDDIVDTYVDLKNKIIAWRVNGIIVASTHINKLSDKMQIVPCIQFENYKDCVCLIKSQTINQRWPIEIKPFNQCQQQEEGLENVIADFPDIKEDYDYEDFKIVYTGQEYHL